MSDHLGKRVCALATLLAVACGVVACAPGPPSTRTDKPMPSVTTASEPVESADATQTPTEAIEIDETVDSAARWILNAWENDPVAFADIETLSDTVVALSAANGNPAVITTMLEQLQLKGQNLLEGSDASPAELAKIIIAADAANQNAQDFLGCEVDPVRELLLLVSTDEGQAAIRDYGRPYIVAVALHRGDERIPQWLVTEMRYRQYGGFHQVIGEDAQEIDPLTTALGISAMAALTQNDTDEETRQEGRDSLNAAVSWAEDPINQQEDGASGGIRWSDDVVATGMLTAALGDASSAGAEESTAPDLAAPVLYLRAQQLSDGGWPGMHDGKESDVAATIAGLLGVVGAGYGSAFTPGVAPITECPASSRTR